MLDVVDRLTLILTMLQQAVAQFLAREARGPYSVWLGTRHYVAVARRDPNAPPAPRPIPADTWRLLAARAERLAWRFRRLVEAWQAGTLPPPRPCAAATPPHAPAAGTPAPGTPAMRPPAPRLPRERGWVNRRLGPAAPCAGLLHALLQFPALQSFVAQVPRAGRLLRPICHALAVDHPAWLKLPSRPAPRRPRARPSSPPTPPTPIRGTPDRPLQPYVRAVVRAWKIRHG
jgi:hypothetical protein